MYIDLEINEMCAFSSIYTSIEFSNFIEKFCLFSASLPSYVAHIDLYFLASFSSHLVFRRSPQVIAFLTTTGINFLVLELLGVSRPT